MAAVVQGPRIFRRGERVRLISELGGAEVTVTGHDITVDTIDVSVGSWVERVPGRASGSYFVCGLTGSTRSYRVDAAALQPLAITWKPGDVVVVTFTTLPYTYVRGVADWPGDRASAKTDEQMTEWYFEGKLRAVLQNGGRPFDHSRLTR